MSIIWIEIDEFLVRRPKTEVWNLKNIAFNRKDPLDLRIIDFQLKLQFALGSEVKSPQLRFWARRGLAAESPTAFSAVTPIKKADRFIK